MEIRSYRRVFDLERRIYRIDRVRLNPAGVPVRGVVYGIGLLAAVAVCEQLVLLGGVVRMIPWYVRDLALPAAGAALLAVIRIEGRAAHLAARALLLHLAGPRRLEGIRACRMVGRRWHPPDLLLLPDGSDARMRAFLYRGPGAVRIALEHERRGSNLARRLRPSRRAGGRASVTVRELPRARELDCASVVSLAEGARLRVRPSSCRAVDS